MALPMCGVTFLSKSMGSQSVSVSTELSDGCIEERKISTAESLAVSTDMPTDVYIDYKNQE